MEIEADASKIADRINGSREIPLQSYFSLFRRFLKFGLLAWGGPVAQIGMLKKELVDEEKWISKERFNRALAIYQLLPGPEAHELCVYFGMLARGRLGGFLAGLGFMLPGFVLMFAFSWLYLRFDLRASIFGAAFLGMQSVVAALIIRAAHRIAEHAINDKPLFLIAALSFVASLWGAPFWIPLAFGGIGYAFFRENQLKFCLTCALLFIASTAFLSRGVFIELDPINSIPSEVKNLASLTELFVVGLRSGLLTFGGAYTAIPFLQHDAVVVGQWMTNEEFLDGVALSGILPAPLIIFSTFVGYVGGGAWGAALITFAIFLPAFLFTLIGHDVLEKVIENKKIHTLLEGVTAAVVGIIAATSVYILASAIKDIPTLMLFGLSLFLSYKLKHKLAVALIVLIGAIAGMLINL